MGSRVLSGALTAALAVGALASTVLSAQDAPAAGGDPQRGRAIANTCLGCHGIPGYKNAYPVYSVPKLDGQHPEYIVAALQGYKSGERAHSTMHSQASSLSDQDMADIAAYFARKPLEPSPDNRPEGVVPEEVQNLCVGCHGMDGIGTLPMNPTLSGQHADYLARALREYKTGGRKNPIMAGFAAQLTDQQIERLAEYYSRQTPGLETAERPYTRLTAGR